jgi:signal transduction histidine kinase/phage shock protein PspC (stress-responsive transcriptional regulator)
VTVNSAAAPSRRLYRATDGRAIAGVARGLAEHLGVDVLFVRLAFVVLAFASWAGVAAYGAFWILVPQDTEAGAATPSMPSTSRPGADRSQLIALGALAIGGVLLVSGIGNIFRSLLLPLALTALGVALVWRQADEAQRERWRVGRWRRSFLLRGLIGVGLVIAGGAVFLASRGELGAARDALFGTIVVVAGLALITGPWWLRMARELAAERRERIRSQERAEVAAHVHDSVLHTLTLIQRHVDDPREVARLARAQERELRAWLYRPPPEAAATLSAELERVAAEVEDAHRVKIDVVVVSDTPTDERLGALLLAAREAMVNAAKYAGESAISVYGEVEPDRVTVFVRDRGKGFDLDSIPEDRLGIRHSIVGRMDRNGGAAIIRSAPGEGTEVKLEMWQTEQ